ncbi:hypothetical protein ABBQ38_013074 [Trebouxia sp. C0009 RCD-2024]
MQAATAVSTRTSLESSGSNHTAATHAAEHDASSQSQQADWPHAFTSTAAPPSSGAWQQHMQPATGTEDCKQLESGASVKGNASPQQSLARLHRRLQRLQDERIHLEGVLAHERSLLAQQRSDNAQLRSNLAQPSACPACSVPSMHRAESADLSWFRTADTKLHMTPAQQQMEVCVPKQQQQHLLQQQLAVDHALALDHAGLHDRQHQRITGSNGAAISDLQSLENQLLQLQGELAMLDSEKSALSVQLTAQQAQHDSERAAWHAQLSTEREDSLNLRQQLTRLSHGRLNESSWHARAVRVEAQHADMVSELSAAQEQCQVCYKQGSQFDAQRGRLFSLKHQKSTGVPQIQDLEAAKQASADQILMNEQQIQYLQQQLDGCRQDLAQMQGQQHYSRDEVDAALAAHQHELTVTQQAFHAKQVQLEGVKQQLLVCKEDQQKLQQQLQASQHDSSSLQSRLDAAVASKQEAEELCLHLHEEVRQLRRQLTGMSHRASLCQSQQLELQASVFPTACVAVTDTPSVVTKHLRTLMFSSGGSQMESMQLLLRDARQHATDLLADNHLLQQSQDRLQKALAQDAQRSSDDLVALQQQLTAAQTDLEIAQGDLARAQESHQKQQQLRQKAATASTSSQTADDSCDRQQLAAEKKLLKAEVASLKRQAAEQLATLWTLQQEFAQEPRAAKDAAFYKGAFLRLYDALSNFWRSIRETCDKLMHSAQTMNRENLRSSVQRRLTVLENIASTLQQSVHSCLLASSNKCL